MIRRFGIRGFKSFEELHIELGRINVFIGANGSGKSNLLEAIGVLGAAASGRVDDEALMRRGVRPGVPALYKSSFRSGKKQQHIRFEAACNQEASYAVSLLNPLESPEPAWSYKHEILEASGAKIVGRSPKSSPRTDPHRGLAALRAVDLDPESPASRLIDDLSEYAIYTPNTPTLRGLVTDPQPRQPLGLSGGGLAEALETWKASNGGLGALEDVREMVDWAAAIAPAGPAELPLSPSVSRSSRVLGFRDRFMAKGRNRLTGYDASEGALYALLVAVLAGHPTTPRILAIDHVDHALNPRLARKLIEKLCEWNEGTGRQVLLTTHNPLVLDGLPLDDDSVRLFAVDRSSTGRSKVERVAVDDRLRTFVEQGWTLSRLWVMGHLGGVPNL